MQPRICVWIAEEDLRTWVVEELQLMTWVVQPKIELVAGEAQLATAALVIVGVDRLAPAELEALRTRTWEARTIAIGADKGIRFDYVLGPRLTSRELKQALRGGLFVGPTQSATG